MLQAIQNRRSIRKYKDTEVPRDMIEEILQAGILAPSSKNRQPWKFIVVSGSAKADMLAAMQKGLTRERTAPLIPKNSMHLDAAEYTLRIMEQAPATIFVVNPLGAVLGEATDVDAHVGEICNAQSIGAAIENMTLTATELGLGSLWICDTYFAYEELCQYLHTEGALFAALAIGYADEAPSARPRKQLSAVTEWRS